MEKLSTEALGREPNPNRIGGILGFKEGLPTSEDFVYRNVQGYAAIQDLIECGYVRNKAAAQDTTSQRWGEAVYWSRGATNKHHALANDAYIIVAPFDTAAEQIVRKEDVAAIYTKNEQGEFIDILPTL